MLPIRTALTGSLLLFRLFREQVVAFFQPADAFLFTEIAVSAVRFIFRIPLFFSFPSLYSGFLISLFLISVNIVKLSITLLYPIKKRPWFFTVHERFFPYVSHILRRIRERSFVPGNLSLTFPRHNDKPPVFPELGTVTGGKGKYLRRGMVRLRIIKGIFLKLFHPEIITFHICMVSCTEIPASDIPGIVFYYRHDLIFYGYPVTLRIIERSEERRVGKEC